MNQLARLFIDGLPLDLTARLLPWRSRFRFSLLTHIHLHARAQEKFADKTEIESKRKMSKTSLLGMIDNLEQAIKKLSWHRHGTEWAEYYEDTNYSVQANSHKKELVANYIQKTAAGSVWDMGGNVGLFSRLAAEQGANTISFDIDPACVELNYLENKRNKESNILPLHLDLTNPSPALGWSNHERMSLLERGPVDLVMALALIHHLAISNNVPLIKIAEFLAKICRFLIIEFVPKDDSQVQRLLSTREDIFVDYSQDNFEKIFQYYFKLLESDRIGDSERTLYLMEIRNE
jgi:hypothetical protein